MADKIGQTCHVHAQGFGEVWSGVLNGHIDVAVKKIFDSAELDTSQDSEIRCVVLFETLPRGTCNCLTASPQMLLCIVYLPCVIPACACSPSLRKIFTESKVRVQCCNSFFVSIVYSITPFVVWICGYVLHAGTRSLSCFLDGESQVVFSFLYMPKSLKVVCSLLLRSGQMDDGNLFLVLVSVSRVRAMYSPVAINQQQVHVFTCFVCCRNS